MSPVKRLSKVLLIGCAVFVLIVVGALVGLGSYVGSENGRTRIEAELAKALDNRVSRRIVRLQLRAASRFSRVLRLR